MPIENRLAGVLRQCLCLVSLTAVVGCLRLQSISLDADGLADAELRRLATSWYGPLLAPGVSQPLVWRPAGGFGDADAIVKALADPWRRKRREFQRHIRKPGFDRAEYYAAIDEHCPVDDILETRYRLQSALGLPLSDNQKARLESLAIVAEHAVLVRNAIFAANGFAWGDFAIDEALSSFRELRAFRLAFADQLSPDLPRLDHAERFSCDATGGALVEALADKTAILDFRGAARRLYTPVGVTRDYFSATAQEIALWGESDRRIIPSRERSVESGDGTTWFAWQAAPGDRLPEKAEFALLLWGVAQPCAIAVDGAITGRISPPPGAVVTQTIPLAGLHPTAGDEVVVIVRIPGKHATPPLRAVVLLAL